MSHFSYIQVIYFIPMISLSSVTFAVTNSLGSVSSAMDSDDDEDVSGKKKSKRGVLPKSATQVMKSWLFQHIVVKKY